MLPFTWLSLLIYTQVVADNVVEIDYFRLIPEVLE